MGYLDGNAAHWQKGYDAPNVDSPVFRFYGRILKPEFGITNGTLLDWGCGQGAAVAYFDRLGFDAYGVDIAKDDIQRGRELWPHLADRLIVSEPEPAWLDTLDLSELDVVVAIQALYYLSNTDLADLLERLHARMRPGGVLYATMMGTRCMFHEHSEPADDGLRKVTWDGPRYSLDDYFVNFVADRDDLVARFPMFDPRFVGWYADDIRGDEGEGFHWTFTGVRR